MVEEDKYDDRQFLEGRQLKNVSKDNFRIIGFPVVCLIVAAIITWV